MEGKDTGLQSGWKLTQGLVWKFDPGHGLEVDLRPILEVSPEIGQEPEVKVITALTPKMSVPELPGLQPGTL